MPNLRSLTCMLVVAAILSGCSDSTTPGPWRENTLSGTRWVLIGWDDAEQTQIFEATDALEGEVIGYAFEKDGALTYRSFGWCATPPLSYFDVSGAWALGDDGVLEVAYPGAVPANPRCFEVVRQTREELRLRPIETEPPVHAFLQGTWEGTFTTAPTNPLVGAPAELGNVTFVVEGSRFRIINEQALVPPPAEGLLAVGQTVVLRDLSYHTADYDWHLNINGHFLWKLQDGELVLHQDMRTRAVVREFRLHRVDE